MSSPVEDPTVVLVVSVFPTGVPGKIRVFVNQAGHVQVSQDEAVFLLDAAGQVVRSGALLDMFPPSP